MIKVVKLLVKNYSRKNICLKYNLILAQNIMLVKEIKSFQTCELNPFAT